MSELNLENLKDYRSEILKAEVVSLIALWDKVNPNTLNKANINLNYNCLISLENYLKDKKIKISGKVFDLWNDFLNNWRSWRKINDSQKILQILYGIGEGLNSGIEKGSPNENIKVEPENKRWLSNTFGGFKTHIYYNSRTAIEVDVVIANIINILGTLIDSSTIEWKTLNIFKEELYLFLSNLLSDNRFPVNDVSLWDQAYMATSMFKANLSNSILKNDFNIPNRDLVRWRILGIQYDKLGLAEMGYKPQQIQWYREKARKIDEEIKKLLEYKYPVGNEIYRDETGIYFLVGEDLGKDLAESSLAELKDDLREIKDKIINIFKEKSLDEFFPAIYLTKASRGLMNLSYLLEKAKENFLKIDWSKKETDICVGKSESGKAKGICQICGQRLVFESGRKDEDKNICDICYEVKTKGRINKWLENTNEESIWMDELKDKNDRIALVTMKFELYDWLNGDMLNSLLMKVDNYKNIKAVLNTLLTEVKKYYTNFLTSDNKNLRSFNSFRNLNSINDFIALFDMDAIQTPYEKVKRKITNILSRNSVLPSNSEDTMILDLFKRNFFDFLIAEWDYIKESNKNDKTKSILNRTNDKIFSIDNYEIFLDKWKNYYQPEGSNLIIDIFCFAFIVGLIKNIIFERSIGDRWEKFIYKKLGDWDRNQNKPLRLKLDFDSRKIHWEKLDDSDIELLSTLILQFILRKNPSPARLRRIWETTREFFEDIKENICNYAGISERRKRRFYWENVDIDDGEYYDGQAIFWAHNKKVYLISYLANNYAYKVENIEDLKDKGFDNIRKYYDDSKIEVSLKWEEAKLEYYQPYMSIIDPTPISWQFIIPAEYLPNFIDNVMKKYNEDFKFVYGKLPLHIGAIIQDYKKPLYVGVKALRKIRRDLKDTEILMIEVKASKIKEKLNCQKNEEKINNTQNYYSLYWGNHNKGFEFYIKPDTNFKKMICDIEKIDDNEDVFMIPNTFDFEFLDTNVRRNDIYYVEHKDSCANSEKGGKRRLYIKKQRPYNIEEYWIKFKKFRDLFGGVNNKMIRTTKLHNLISLIYDKINDSEKFKEYLAASFINILDLKKDVELRNGIADILGINTDNGNFYTELKDKMTEENLMLILDIFDFWHKSLKEV